MKPNQFGGGTDIGTTYSAIAKAHNLESPAQLLEAKNGSHHIPSYVYYDQNERAQVGEIAINQEPTATVYDNKRFIGQTFNEVKHYIEDYPFKIIADPNSDYILYQLSSNGHEFTKTPLEVATDQLAHYHDVMTARVDMKNCIGMTGTHPAYFKSIQKFATLNAAKKAGFETLHMIDEPTSAACAYVIDNKKLYDEKVKKEGIYDDDGTFHTFKALVADFGGGTSDFSKIDFNASIEAESDIVKYEIVGRNITGIQQFGGQDITKSIQSDFVHQLQQIMGKKWEKLENDDIEDIKTGLLKEAECVKKFLCDSISYKTRYRWNRKNYELIMTRSKLKQINAEHIKMIQVQVNDCIGKEKIDQLLFVGGSSELPFIMECVQECVSSECEIVQINNKRDLVARGAAYVSVIRHQMNPIITFQQINSFNLGFGTLKGEMVPLIKRGDSIPFTQRTPRNYVNPDTSQFCSLSIYEGNSALIESCTFIGREEVNFGSKKEAGTFKMKVTAKLDNYGIFEAIVTPANDPEKQLAKFSINLGSQGKFGSESIESKEALDRDRKKYQEEKQKLDNYQDDYYFVLGKLNNFDVDGKQMKHWDNWMRSATTFEDWEKLLQSMKSLLVFYENQNSKPHSSDHDSEPDSDSSTVPVSDIEIITKKQIDDCDISQSAKDNDNNHNKNQLNKKSVQPQNTESSAINTDDENDNNTQLSDQDDQSGSQSQQNSQSVQPENESPVVATSDNQSSSQSHQNSKTVQSENDSAKATISDTVNINVVDESVIDSSPLNETIKPQKRRSRRLANKTKSTNDDNQDRKSTGGKKSKKSTAKKKTKEQKPNIKNNENSELKTTDNDIDVKTKESKTKKSIRFDDSEKSQNSTTSRRRRKRKNRDNKKCNNEPVHKKRKLS